MSSRIRAHCGALAKDDFATSDAAELMSIESLDTYLRENAGAEPVARYAGCWRSERNLRRLASDLPGARLPLRVTRVGVLSFASASRLRAFACNPFNSTNLFQSFLHRL